MWNHIIDFLLINLAYCKSFMCSTNPQNGFIYYELVFVLHDSFLQPFCSLGRGEFWRMWLYIFSAKISVSSFHIKCICFQLFSSLHWPLWHCTLFQYFSDLSNNPSMRFYQFLVPESMISVKDRGFQFLITYFTSCSEISSCLSRQFRLYLTS